MDRQHHLAAARLSGADMLPMRWFDGFDADAFVAAVRLNPGHGLPLTGPERSTAAERVLFDPATVAAGSTFDEPRTFPVGLPHVLIDGRFVIEDGRRTSVLAGRSVRGTGAAPRG